ncbi:VOC family protein [Pseudarthrobacter sp. P1]|uniref:VOC family protein n=1 Tax=Pseudarthrobacter sp. P1 TaxID=3418418 RepID=UPI003CE67434
MNIAHIGFTVSDLDAAIAFFEGHFGFELRSRQIQDNPYTRATVGVPDAVIDNAILTSPGSGGSELQLLEYRAPKTAGTFSPVQQPGATHLALAVEDIHQLHQRTAAAGVAYSSPPNLIDSGRNAGGYIAYAIGPDGLRVELFQPAPLPVPAQ